MTHQGFAGSIGTSALLVGAAVSILLAVGAFLAFEGFPGPSGEGPAETFLLESATGALERPDPQLVLSPSAGAPSGASESASAAAAPDDFFTPPDSAVASAVPATAPAPVVPSGSGQVPDGPGGSGSSSNGDGMLGSTVNQVSDGVRSTSGSADGLVDGVLPGRNADAVSGATNPLVDTVDGLSSTLDRVERRLGD